MQSTVVSKWGLTRPAVGAGSVVEFSTQTQHLSLVLSARYEAWEDKLCGIWAQLMLSLLGAIRIVERQQVPAHVPTTMIPGHPQTVWLVTTASLQRYHRGWHWGEPCSVTQPATSNCEKKVPKSSRDVTCSGPHGSLVGLCATVDHNHHPIRSPRTETLKGTLLTADLQTPTFLQGVVVFIQKDLVKLKVSLWWWPVKGQAGGGAGFYGQAGDGGRPWWDRKL